MFELVKTLTNGLYSRTTHNRKQMSELKLLERITIDPNICHGKPCLRGLRYPVEFVLELLSGGMTIEEILQDYDDLEREDILAALQFATRLTQVKSIYSIVP